MSGSAAAAGEVCIGTPAARPVSVAAAAEAAERAWLKDNVTQLEYKTGGQNPKKPFSPVTQQLRRNCCCLLEPRTPDPASKLSSSIEDFVKYEQRFGIMHPLVSAS